MLEKMLLIDLVFDQLPFDDLYLLLFRHLIQDVNFFYDSASDQIRLFRDESNNTKRCASSRPAGHGLFHSQ